ncbi:transporter substrate-binding domain-containing protein [Bradyrhizobium sp. 157]|nr:transporter substrate-binding domain-containing protein [Bradyrhizobium sp. 157]
MPARSAPRSTSSRCCPTSIPLRLFSTPSTRPPDFGRIAMTEPTLDRRQVLKLEAATMAALAGGMPSIAGAAVAYVLDDVQLAVAIARSKDPSAYIISDKTFSKAEPYGTMLRKDDAAFKAVADRTTAELYRSPEIEALYKKWLESPVPPNGLNFNTPMSAVLRKAFANPSDSPDPASYER